MQPPVCEPVRYIITLALTPLVLLPLVQQQADNEGSAAASAVIDGAVGRTARPAAMEAVVVPNIDEEDE